MRSFRVTIDIRSRVVPFKRRQAFTLVELLVVIGIILTLTVVTITSFNFSINADRIRSGARQFQSFLAGARDKAILANDVRGVRLLLDPNDNHTISGMQYIGSPDQETGSLDADLTKDATLHTMRVHSTSSSAGRWGTLKNRGYLRVGNRIQIPAHTGSWFVISAILPGSPDPELVLNQPVAGVVLPSSYILDLAPGILGDAQPVAFPRGVVIDLDGSTVPSTWRPAAFSGAYGTQATLDILFTPRGTVTGDCGSAGIVHLHFADMTDVTKWHQLTGRSSVDFSSVTSSPPSIPPVPVDSLVARDRVAATLVARTGNVGVYYVNGNGSGSFASDPYSFAETGQVANK